MSHNYLRQFHGSGHSLLFVCCIYKFHLIYFVFLRLFFQSHQDEIRCLPDALAGKIDPLPDLLFKSRSDSTRHKYECSFIRWKKWALSNDLGRGDILPAKAFHVAIYLSSLIQSCKTSSPLTSAFYAMKWYHEIYDFESPTNSKLVINILEAGKRILAKPSVKKDPITPELLKVLYDNVFEHANIKNQRIISACLVAYAGFMRSSELLNIKVCDIMFYETFMSIFVESSKTDKYRDGAWLTIARTGTELCPVANIEKLITWAGLSSDDFVFCNLSKKKTGYVVRKNNKAMSYSTFRDEFIRVFKPFVDDINKYCLHSLRSGGATSAANNGVKDRMFKRHGRWLSDSAKDGYVKDSLKERLSVSLSLGL